MGDYSYGDTCDIDCYSGFALNGSANRMCQVDGTWSGTDGTCVKGNNVLLTEIAVIV